MLVFPAGDLRSTELEGQIQGHGAAGALAYLCEHLEYIFGFPITRNSKGPSFIFLSSCRCYMALLALAFMVFLFLPGLYSSENV